jgi:3-methyladenine DNA glycosylase AlkC
MTPKPEKSTHPSQRFAAPTSIQKGIPLATLLNRAAVRLLAESMEAVAPRFNSDRFIRTATRQIDGLKFMDRAARIADALATELPADFSRAAPILIASLGPELSTTVGNGLAIFFYLPHSHYIAQYGVEHHESGMQACYELTKRFTAEFCIRTFLLTRPRETLQVLKEWSFDPNPHVRRLVSEGTRPRLPWGIRLPAFQEDPTPTLRLLELLKDDPVAYVHRSVANHLGDIIKDNPKIGYAACERWLRTAKGCPPESRATRQWVVRHALRFPAKRGEPRAIKLRQAARG